MKQNIPFGHGIPIRLRDRRESDRMENSSNYIDLLPLKTSQLLGIVRLAFFFEQRSNSIKIPAYITLFARTIDVTEWISN